MIDQERVGDFCPCDRGAVGGLATSARLSTAPPDCCSCSTAVLVGVDNRGGATLRAVVPGVAGDAGGDGARIRDPTFDWDWPSFGSLPEPGLLALPGTGSLPTAII